MAHAVIRTGGKQFLVEEGKTIRVPSVDAEAGKSIELETGSPPGLHDPENRFDRMKADDGR